MRTHADLWYSAYAKLYANKGALTPGVSGNTLDGFGEERVAALMHAISTGTYKPSPVRRTYILKDPKNPAGKKRPLGIPTGDDKLVQEVVRALLEVIYEPVFSDRSHGFRPGRSCHTALNQIVRSWKGTKWICEVDIKGYFDNIDHETLLGLLARKIDDRAFLKLIREFLVAGYLEDWTYNATYSGTPQGGVVSPILANIYLHELDQFMDSRMAAFNRGARRKPNPEYCRLNNLASIRRRKLRVHGDSHSKAARWRQEMQEMEAAKALLPSVDMHDEGFKQLHYVRYADDFLIGIVGSKEEAAQIMAEVRSFVEGPLKLTISAEKSRMGAMSKGTVFLGYGVQTRRLDKRMKCRLEAWGKAVFAVKRTVTDHIHLYVPEEKIRNFAVAKGYGVMDAGRNDIRFRPMMLPLSDYEIVVQYNAELRGFANYYALAPKYYLNRLEWMANTSLFKTLARKHDTSWGKMFARMRCPVHGHSLAYHLEGEERRLPVFRLKHRWVAASQNPDAKPNIHTFASRSELLRRIAARKCEYCGTEDAPFEVHHVRKLADLKDGTSHWQRLMSARRRKTLVLCRPCHVDLHRGTLPDNRFALAGSEMESRMR
ncbi:retron-type reverse transcriptase [Pelagibacterium halotolerans B2]|uniref:Retron-type reverse transcriptase n=2 Tax=Pelagibacterium TaxID=1082930 RepID=G4RDQ7_PELHB|nr:retron-type reverse transcriptase [Pelagibacterium halotolerans B2]